MPHDNRFFDDTSPEIAAMLIKHWHETPPAEKLAQMSSMNATVEELALAGIARQYPNESPAQLQRRFRERLYGKELVDRVYAQFNATETGN